MTGEPSAKSREVDNVTVVLDVAARTFDRVEPAAADGAIGYKGRESRLN